MSWVYPGLGVALIVQCVKWHGSRLLLGQGACHSTWMRCSPRRNLVPSRISQVGHAIPSHISKLVTRSFLPTLPLASLFSACRVASSFLLFSFLLFPSVERASLRFETAGQLIYLLRFLFHSLRLSTSIPTLRTRPLVLQLGSGIFNYFNQDVLHCKDGGRHPGRGLGLRSSFLYQHYFDTVQGFC